MNSPYQTLQTIYEIVKDDPQPQTYLCRPRELILRQMKNWDLIHQELIQLEEQGLIVTRQLDTLSISITILGLERIKSASALENTGIPKA
jgi:hypothetical protein